MHHMEEVEDGGKNEAGNLLPLCPTCHAMYTRGTIKRESIYAWKTMLVSLSHAFDVVTVDHLLFLRPSNAGNLLISGDGVLHFARLIASGLANFKEVQRNGPLVIYTVRLTEKGKRLVSAWVSGDWAKIEKALGK